ncbi:Undecaprenyl-phosphate mannosyltransferase [Aquicella siphonis]|uniref:Undecaprenyl-phosphate mannosyltransferase n=1 Tax=Aquicella siphonis TaxID=254247 RepID=A0A5E4PJ09_9COXI|nr:polyprenol monophosphomannose synthase [Aquicella siphonis]VVC77000.1 Undecaprenyl-phosphate mannosyltransferase [Aquicella siphonis]
MDNNRDTSFSIIIPTYCEARNIPDLAQRIANVDFGGRQFEVLLIDDNSQDGIANVVHHLAFAYPWLQLIVRTEKRDLSQSVICGFRNARHPLIVTMDADLSHPPESIPAMLEMLADTGTDMVIGSRYIPGGSSDHNWPFIRKITSRTAALIARMLLTAPVKDPLSGFLAFRKDLFLSGDPLEPIGWKVGLELMIKCRCKNIREIPIHFSQRSHGKSKLNMKISFDYLRHIIKLMRYQLFA